MMYNLPKALRQALAVALVVLPLGAISFFVIAPVWGHVADLKAEIEQERQLAGRLTEITGDESGKRALSEAVETHARSLIYAIKRVDGNWLLLMQEGTKFPDCARVPTKPF